MGFKHLQTGPTYFRDVSQVPTLTMLITATKNFTPIASEPYTGWKSARLRAIRFHHKPFISQIGFLFYFISIFIFLNCRKASKTLYTRQAVTPTCFRGYQDIVVRLKCFILDFYLYRDMTGI